MKCFSKVFVFVLLALFVGSSSAMAIPVGDALQGVFNDIATDGTNDVNVKTDMIGDASDSTWEITASGGSVATFIIELAGFADKNKFGVYQCGQYVQIFDGSDTQSDQARLTLMADGTVKVDGTVQAGVKFNGNYFGYYLDSSANNGGGLFHSDTSLNDDGLDHMLAYQGVGEEVQLPGYFAGDWTPNEYILAFEDVYGGGDQDFTDMVVMVESVQPIPEPATMILFGLGLIGIAGFGRKKV